VYRTFSRLAYRAMSRTRYIYAIGGVSYRPVSLAKFFVLLLHAKHRCHGIFKIHTTTDGDVFKNLLRFFLVTSLHRGGWGHVSVIQLTSQEHCPWLMKSAEHYSQMHWHNVDMDGKCRTLFSGGISQR
jgi:hypothetical protein